MTNRAPPIMRMLWLIAAALAARALVPSGYMIDTAQAATAWPVVLCPDGLPAGALAHHTAPPPPHHGAHHAHGMHEAPPAEDGHAGHLPAKHDPKAKESCAFSGLGAPALTAPPAASIPAPALTGAPAVAAVPVSIGRGLAAPPPPSTGPPSPL